MTEQDPLLLWRLMDELSVEDAAILLAGGDPGAVDTTWLSFEEQVQTKRTSGHPNFVPAFTLIKTAVLSGKIPARIRHRSQDRAHYTPHFDPDSWVVTKGDLAKILDPDDPWGSTHGTLEVMKEPDWTATTVEVEDLRQWLRQRGFTRGFFFSDHEEDLDSFMDPSHEHFAPELALAVAAWRALSSEQKFPRGPKAAIEAWIDANAGAWKGGGELSASAKDRVVTLVNWRRTGGAPTSGS